MDSNSALEVAVVLHVLGAAVVVGVRVATFVYAHRLAARGERSAEAAAAFASDSRWLATRIDMPAMLVVMLSGGYAIGEGGWKLDTAWWIGAGIALWVVVGVGGTLARMPHLRAVDQAIAGSDGDAAAAEAARSEDVAWRIHRVQLVTGAELLLLTVALVLMVAKPS